MSALRLILPALLMLAFLPYAQTASAQCGAGIPSGGNPNCIPPDAYHSQGIQQPQMQTPRVTVIKQKWADRWGGDIGGWDSGIAGLCDGLPEQEGGRKSGDSAVLGWRRE